MNNINLDWFSFWAGIVPDQKAITILNDDQSYTYGEIDIKGQKIASELYHELGIRKGDRIGILAKNCIESIYLFAAAQKLGIILVPFNYRLTPYELSQLMTDAELSILFYDEEFKSEGLNTKAMPLSIVHEFDNIKNTPQVSCSSEDPVFVLYTSGSTGVPKGVIYTHRMLYWNSLNTSVSLGINSESSALVCMPLFHTGGWNVLLTPILHHGGHVIITEKFDSNQILSALEKHNCNQFMAVPTMLKMMAEDPSFQKIELPSLPYIIVGGEALPIELIKIYEAKNISIRQGFGMTEAGPNLTSLHHIQSIKKIGSIGKPNMYVKVKLIGESGNEVKPGELGELYFAGPIVMPAYWRNEKESNKAIVNGWLQSGDIGMMDDQGYLYIKDRKKNMFISGGENVYPAELEKVILKHDAINEVIVIGVPNEKWGEVGKAFIVVNKPITEDELKDFCRQKLSKYKIPKYFEFIDEMPLSSTGKIDRKSLINRVK
jgi:fatty-acyl-CoA synthase